MVRTQTPWGVWEPAPLGEVVALLTGGPTRWWIAGGYAIELAVGRPIREHTDIDVLLLRRDHLAIQDVLAGWQWWAADPPGVLRPWRPGELLPVGVHDIWCRPDVDQPWRVQFMLDESRGANWISRRNPDVWRPIATLGDTSSDGIPFLRPEIQLFYKAKERRAKDDVDFTAVLPVLAVEQRRWLADAITRTYGPHPWLRHLTSEKRPSH